MAELPLPALEGTNPLGFLAALGCLVGLTRQIPDRTPTLRWTDDVVPTAVVSGPSDESELVALLLADRDTWEQSKVLDDGPEGAAIDEVKLDPDALRRWILTTKASASPNARGDIDLLCALVAETALDNNGNAKPTDLHFLAGQQRLLDMARHLRNGLKEQDFEEGLIGPWQRQSSLPSLGWDIAGERVYALRAINPTKEEKLGVAAANWLGFIGLTLLPVMARNGAAATTGGGGGWKRGTFTWPLWNVPLTEAMVASVLGISGLAGLSPAELRARGLMRVLRSPIRRTDQGGYGSIGIPDVVATASDC